MAGQDVHLSSDPRCRLRRPSARRRDGGRKLGNDAQSMTLDGGARDAVRAHATSADRVARKPTLGTSQTWLELNCSRTKG
jgi:hypothetical protein